MYVYQTGSKIKVNRPADTYWHGKVGEITGRSTYSDTYMVQIDGESQHCWFLESQLVPADLTNVTSAEPPSPDEVIADLTEQLYDMCREAETLRSELNRSQERLGESQRDYRHDMQHWETTLRDTKEQQNWCDEGTNEVIRTLNSGFQGGWQIDEYLDEFEIEITVRGTIETTTSVMVEARSREAALEKVLEDTDDYFDCDEILTDAARSVSFTDIETEEA